MDLYQLIYVSKSVSVMPKYELRRILKRARQANAVEEITGILVFDSGHFFQVLEGGYNQVEGLFSRIQQDRRHTRVNRMSSCYTQERFFPDWNMGFYNLEEIADLDFFKLRSYLKTFQDINTIEEKKNLAKYALQTFLELKENRQVLQIL